MCFTVRQNEHSVLFQSVITCLNLTLETLEEGANFEHI